ncbi:uncharacterized protein LOC106457325 isoform X2 [Limulus polyphemus]|uniref:Uncharacterized protein LOC106457325 isoform X2 n=1 Tax=Limulus polyphemus TaxID=6850 RepID=A0ABM1S5K0_LIMPO|nr:uncharacterized protein LOC106457325 isoform X2 [Limulus polyphemus]
MFTFLLLINTLFVQAVLCLKLTELDVPSVVKQGAPVWLYCGYDLEEDELYSVKWYKNHVEFYRYLPSDEPPGQKYDLLGVHINLSKSNQTHVYLEKTDVNSEGSYGCEVSTEAPSYRTVKADKDMNVYVLPEGKPIIDGIDRMYDIGEYVNLTCKSRPSKPVAVLSWSINGQPVDERFLTPMQIERYVDGLESAVLSLQFHVTLNNFNQGVMKVRCTATISQDYYSHSEETVIGERLKTATPDPGPKISGGQTRYRVGDVVDVNCTSAIDVRPAELQWFINEKKARPGYIIKYPNINYLGSMVASVLGLKFRVRQEHFLSDGLRLKCTATVSRIIGTSSKELTVGNLRHSSGPHVSENSGSALNKGSSCYVQVWLFWCFVAILCSITD